MSEIMLAKTFDASKIDYPAEVSIKLDGIAADFYKNPNGWLCQSRQAKPIPSTGHIIKWLNEHADDLPVNTHIIGELTVVGVSAFKDAGGIIRRQEVDERIVLNAYDMYSVGHENLPYSQRIDKLDTFLTKTKKASVRASEGLITHIIKRVPVLGRVSNENELNAHIKSLGKLLEQSDLFEGLMIRSLDGKHSKYGVGKRSHGMMKYKERPTIDLEVVGFEEATANKNITFLGEEFEPGQGLRAVGRILVLYSNGASSDGKNEYTDFEVEGAGPGCLTHEERRDLWERYKANDEKIIGPLIAEIQYMRDNNYKGLREPVFKRWRPDKSKPSQEA